MRLFGISRVSGNHHALIEETVVRPIANDDVIKHTDSQQPCHIEKPLGELFVFVTRRRIPARVIVDKEHGCSALPDGWMENLPRMNDRTVQRAD